MTDQPRTDNRFPTPEQIKDAVRVACGITGDHPLAVLEDKVPKLRSRYLACAALWGLYPGVKRVAIALACGCSTEDEAKALVRYVEKTGSTGSIRWWKWEDVSLIQKAVGIPVQLAPRSRSRSHGKPDDQPRRAPVTLNVQPPPLAAVKAVPSLGRLYRGEVYPVPRRDVKPVRQDVTAAWLGDPAPGRSALDRRTAAL